MFNFLFKIFSQSFQLFFLRLGLGGKNYQNFQDLNFKQNDFINYKIIKYYIHKDNFVNNVNILDAHTFNFLSFYQKLGGKKGIELSKKNIFSWYKNLNIIKNFHGAATMPQKDL